MTATSRGERSDLLHSMWILWTLVPLLGWIGFLWIGRQARHRRWLAWGAVYLLPLVVVIVLVAIGYRDNSSTATFVGFVILLSPLPPAIHAFSIRKDYLLRREAVDQVKAKEEQKHKASIAAEYGDQDARSRVTGILNQCDSIITEIEASAAEDAISGQPVLQQRYNQALDLRQRGSILLDRASSPYEIEQAEPPLSQALAQLQQLQDALTPGARISRP